MIKLTSCLALFILTMPVDFLCGKVEQLATMKPESLCCDIPELGDAKHLATCSNPKLQGPCNDIKCIFEQSGFLYNNDTLNKDVYKNHLKQWAEIHKGWTDAVDTAIRECVNTDPRQMLEDPCKAYDVFTCTGLAMTKKCPVKAWKCYTIVTKYNLVIPNWS